MRVCFIGTDRKIQQMFRNALKGKADFAFSFINDTEQAKEWFVSEQEEKIHGKSGKKTGVETC